MRQGLREPAPVRRGILYGGPRMACSHPNVGAPTRGSPFQGRRGGPHRLRLRSIPSWRRRSRGLTARRPTLTARGLVRHRTPRQQCPEQNHIRCVRDIGVACGPGPAARFHRHSGWKRRRHRPPRRHDAAHSPWSGGAAAARSPWISHRSTLVDQPKRMVPIRFEKLTHQIKELWFDLLATDGFHLSRSNH